jgi:hypothetical protein
MPVGADEKIDYQTLEASSSLSSWLTSGSANQPKIVAFISPSDDLGMNGLLSVVAKAMSALDKQVKVIHVDGDSQDGDGLAEDSEILLEMSGVADYLLVGLPSQLTTFAGEILINCDLIIVASSCKIEFLPETENVVKALLHLGIDTDKVAGLLFDPEGILSSASLADIRPYLEANLGLEIAGVVSFESGPSDRMSQDIETLAQYIVPHGNPELEMAFSRAL